MKKKEKKKEILIISLGGSIIVPDKVDYDFLYKFKKIILREAKQRKIFICTGGGKTARNYINALEREKLSKHERDLIGIEATRLNAKLVSSFLSGNQQIPFTLQEVGKMIKKRKIVVCGGLKKGVTSDGTTAEIAKYLNAKTLINVTNVKGLYDKDPKKYPNAKFIPNISYKEFANIMKKIKEKPGQHFILDSLATKIIQKSKIKTIILGKNLENFENFIKGKKFIGTIIS